MSTGADTGTGTGTGRAASGRAAVGMSGAPAPSWCLLSCSRCWCSGLASRGLPGRRRHGAPRSRQPTSRRSRAPRPRVTVLRRARSCPRRCAATGASSTRASTRGQGSCGSRCRSTWPSGPSTWVWRARSRGQVRRRPALPVRAPGACWGARRAAPGQEMPGSWVPRVPGPGRPGPGRRGPGRRVPGQRGACARTASSSRTAAAFSSGLLNVPHLGDCTHAGQPSVQGHASIASRVARNHVAPSS